MSEKDTRKPNRLIDQTSPYLLQHAYNPVDWYPWGPEALQTARESGRPIFLSIGYSACHWCHVMEHESFEDPAVAEKMNAYFVNIKVDREERPDLDGIYMNAVQLMTGHGGWPMSVWLTPDLRPFYGGTYFPPAPRFGMPAFGQVVESLHQAWMTRREEIDRASQEMVAHLDRLGRIVDVGQHQANAAQLTAAAQQIHRLVDTTWGGIGRAPKFPHSIELRLLLRVAAVTNHPDYRDAAVASLAAMIDGGIHDQLGGGFHRYSTDERWLVPHFEKMLYDNALIPLACLEAYQVTGEARFADAAVDTLDYVLREMTDPAGGFYSSQDADSEGVEGKFFVWDKREIVELLGAEQAEPFCAYYGVTDAGNWEGKNILHRTGSLQRYAAMFQLDAEALSQKLAEGRQKLFANRQRRIAPGRDDKILTSWNAMMIDAMAVASSVLDEPRYRDAAVRSAEFALTQTRDAAGRLYRTWKQGRAHLMGYLEDYAYLAHALLSLYEATFDPRWVIEARAVIDPLFEHFWDDDQGGFFFTADDHETLITRGKDPTDGAIPSGNAMAATALARLVKLTGDGVYTERLEQLFARFAGQMAEQPLGSSQMLLALGMYLGPTWELAIIGEPQHADTRRLLAAIYGRFLPNKVVALSPPKLVGERAQVVPLLAGKVSIEGQLTLYVCRDFTCETPAVGLAAALPRLDQIADVDTPR